MRVRMTNYAAGGPDDGPDPLYLETVRHANWWTTGGPVLRSLSETDSSACMVEWNWLA